MLRVAAIFLTASAIFLWANNTSLLVSIPEESGLRFLSHRGVHQTYAGNELTNDTCTARPVKPIVHPFIENTLPSMEAAFEAGADVVELDVHLTTDGVFAVFHDWTLDCRTNGAGQTNQSAYATLKELDAGYGYSADGTTFPLRGTGIGLIPTLQDVFEAFPDGQFLINFKSKRRLEGEALAKLLTDEPAYRKRVFGVYGGDTPTRTVLAAHPTLRGYDRRSLTDCLYAYIAIGWSGYVPQSCRDQLLAVPVNYARYLWGWPDRFQNRMENAGTTLLLLGPYDGGGFSSGIDDPQTFDRVPKNFRGFVWTNRVEKIAPLSR